MVASSNVVLLTTHAASARKLDKPNAHRRNVEYDASRYGGCTLTLRVHHMVSSCLATAQVQYSRLATWPTTTT